MPSTPVLQGKIFVAFLLILTLVVSYVLCFAATPTGWPDGWSKPVQVGAGDRNYGYASTALGPTSVLIATARDTQNHAVLQVEKIDVHTKQSTPLLTLPVSGLASYMLFSHGEVGKLGFVDRRDGVSRIHVQSAFSLPDEPLIIKESTGVIADFTALIDSRGETLYAWSNSELGLRNINLQRRDASGNLLWEHVVDSPNTLDTNPVILAGQNDLLYLLHRQSDTFITELIFTAFDLSTGKSSVPLSLGRVGQDSQQMPTLLPNADSSVDIIWAKETLARGQVRGTEISMGTLSALGKWITPLAKLYTQVGSNTALDASRRQHTVAVWLNDASGSFQIDSVALELQGDIMSHGPVTVGTGQRFAPQVHWVGEHKAVLFQEIDAHGLQVFLVDDLNPSKPPLAFWLGLDLEAPFLDAAFRYFSLAVAALTLGSLATVGLAVAVACVLLGRKLGLLSPSLPNLPAQVCVFAILSLLKRSGTFLYHGAVLVEGPMGLLIMVGSAVFAIITLRFGDADDADTLTLALGAFLFVVADAFCSIYVRGLGQW